MKPLPRCQYAAHWAQAEEGWISEADFEAQIEADPDYKQWLIDEGHITGKGPKI